MMSTFKSEISYVDQLYPFIACPIQRVTLFQQNGDAVGSIDPKTCFKDN